MSEDNVWREPEVGEIVVGTKRSHMEHREHAFASRHQGLETLPYLETIVRLERTSGAIAQFGRLTWRD